MIRVNLLYLPFFKLEVDYSHVPDVEKECVRSVKKKEDQKLVLKDFAVTKDYGKYVNANLKCISNANARKNSCAIGCFNFYEYTNLRDNDIRAILTTIAPESAIKELEKLEKFAFLQIYSAKKQAEIYIGKNLAKIKSLENNSDFYVTDFDNIQNDENMKLIQRDTKYKYHKANDGTFKLFHKLKEKPSYPDLVSQRYQFKCLKDPDVTYHILRIFETTDKELKNFAKMCLVQKVDKKHQAITLPNEIVKYMKNVISKSDIQN